MTNATQGWDAWIGRQVLDAAGNKVGKVSQIYIDNESGEAEWLAVNTGMFASKASFVPLEAATSDGDHLVIQYDKAKVKDAPRVEEDADGFLTPEEETALYEYYGRTYSARTDGDGGRSGTVGRDVSGPTTDDAMTRSEEQVRVGTQTVESGRVRLRKYVVTEHVTQTVPVSHEEVRIEREPITDANRAAATSGPDISEETHEAVLHSERPVVEKEVVPQERVRLATETVTGQETVGEDVRKEVIEPEGDKSAARR